MFGFHADTNGSASSEESLFVLRYTFLFIDCSESPSSSLGSLGYVAKYSLQSPLLQVQMFRQEMPFHVGSASQRQATRSGSLSGTHLGNILPHLFQIEAIMYLHRS